jgi:YVTN family beta-propeller protein
VIKAAPGRPLRAVGLITVAALAVVGNPQAAGAQFVDQVATGGQSVASATLAIPAGLASGTPACAPSDVEGTVVPLTWTGSTAEDADGNQVVGYYDILRSVDGGAYTSVGSTSGAPPVTAFSDGTATDVPALPSNYYAISGDSLEYSNGTGPTWATVGNYSFGSEENLLAATPDGSRLYVAESGPGAHQVLVIDTAPGGNNAVVSTIDLAGPAPVPVAVAMAPNGTEAYVLDGANDEVDVVPVPTPPGAYAVTTTIPVGDLGDPAAVAVSPSSSQLLVANYNSGTVSLIATSTGTVTTVSLPGANSPQPTGVVVVPSGAGAYVEDAANDTVDEISLTGPTAGTVVGEVSVPDLGNDDSPAGIDVADGSSAGPEVYVADAGAATVSVISVATNAVTNVPVAPADEAPVALAAAPDGCWVAVVTTGSGGTGVSTINTATNSATSTTPLAGLASAIALPGSSNGSETADGAIVAMPVELNYELQAAQTAAGGGFESAYSAPITLSLGRGQLP